MHAFMLHDPFSGSAWQKFLLLCLANTEVELHLRPDHRTGSQRPIHVQLPNSTRHATTQIPTQPRHPAIYLQEPRIPPTHKKEVETKTPHIPPPPQPTQRRITQNPFLTSHTNRTPTLPPPPSPSPPPARNTPRNSNIEHRLHRREHAQARNDHDPDAGTRTQVL